MPADKVSFYNQIDVGIFLCFLDLCLQHNGMEYTVDLHVDRGTDTERIKVATYYFHGNGKSGSKGVDGHKREYYSKFNDER